MLIWKTEGSENVLLNTFCKKKNEKIDLKEIRIIADWALDGCMSTNVINEEAIKACEKYAFSNSALLMRPFTNGLRFAGRILIDAEEGADACLPKDFVMARVWISADLRKLKSLRIENYANLKIVALITKIPKRIIFADKKQADIKEILQDISNPKLESNHEEDMIQLLALKILPEEKLKMIQEYIGIARPEWTTSLAYVLESLKNCSKKTNMYDI